MKSLSEIRQSEHVGRPERTYSLCVAGRLSAEMSILDRQLEQAMLAEESTTRRMGAKSEAKKIAEKADEIREQMAEHTVELRLRATDNGAWRRWCRAHPARDGEDRDGLYKVAICNSDDLIANLGEYIVKIGDTEPAKGDVEFITENASYGDLLQIARIVMGMHETAVDVPFSRVAWLATRAKERGSE